MQAVLLGEWADWLRAGGASEKTVETRCAGVVAACRFNGHDDPVSLTTRQLIVWLARCRSPWTRRTYWTSIRAWFRWLADEGVRLDDPTERVPKPPQPKGVPRPAPTASLGAVLEIAPRKAMAYIKLAAYEGLRVHEIAKLRAEDFDGDSLYVLGKGSHMDVIPIHPEVEQLRNGFPVQGWWFPSLTELGHVRPQAVSSTISRTFHQAGFEINAHMLRHWFGTHTLRNSRDLRVTQELMRHMSVASTQIYTEVAKRAKVEAINRLAAS